MDIIRNLDFKKEVLEQEGCNGANGHIRFWKRPERGVCGVDL